MINLKKLIAKRWTSPQSSIHNPQSSYCHPKYWLLWLVISILWLLAKLPYRTLLFLGTYLGRLFYYMPSKAKRIAKINIARCFPNLEKNAQQKLLKKHFESLGISIFETALAWFGSAKRLKQLSHFHGFDQWNQTQPQGIILLGLHFTTLELVGKLTALHYPFAVVYREHKKPFINFLITKMLNKHYHDAIPKQNIRAMIKLLRNHGKLWYTADIDAGHYEHIFAPFFGIQAASLTATARLPKLGQAKVIPVTFYRRDDGTGYDIYANQPLEHFPSDDIITDITRINALQEDLIRKKPEQYMWSYMRFKTRPQGEKRFYGSKRR